MSAFLPPLSSPISSFPKQAGKGGVWEMAQAVPGTHHKQPVTLNPPLSLILFARAYADGARAKIR